MKKIAASLLIILAGYSALGAYKSMHKKKRKQVKKTSTVVANNTKIKSVLMGRSACYGTCPTYTLEIFETGLLRYTGKSHVEHEGVYEKNIGAVKTLQFIKEFDAIRPETMSYRYEQRIADLPSIYYFISYADSIKHIFNAADGPEVMTQWANKFDDFAVVDATWKKQEPAMLK